MNYDLWKTESREDEAARLERPLGRRQRNWAAAMEDPNFDPDRLAEEREESRMERDILDYQEGDL